MQTESGISILKGIAIGRVRYFEKKEYDAVGRLHGEPLQEWKRFEEAKVRVQEQQEKLYEKTAQTAGGSMRRFFICMQKFWRMRHSFQEFAEG